MTERIRYIHGSEDSTDLDVYYVFDTIPSDIKDCRAFCSADPNENRNIIVIKKGIVTDTFIGTPDEINNGLIDTYHLHKQEYPLLITKRVERNVILKQIRAVRGILSILSRTKYRPQIKFALRNNWSDRIILLKMLDFTEIDYENLHKQNNYHDMLKVIAFQTGQGLGLLLGEELYTKSSIAKEYPLLKPFLYREENLNFENLNKMLLMFYTELRKIDFEEEGSDIVYFPKYNKKYELRHEMEVK
ncbi:hypothetical protein [Thomasclavelia cocleata]|uniref:hypothetical protein n=1 Tax=Thomasclavelia cocleata TaxID=69824 RepID=UPI00256EA1D9|nr:hypothetical protein [Thomasclavelia cocleata]